MSNSDFKWVIVMICCLCLNGLLLVYYKPQKIYTEKCEVLAQNQYSKKVIELTLNCPTCGNITVKTLHTRNWGDYAKYHYVKQCKQLNK